jgi:Pyridine nucleotide-disulphide oxidoreductase
LLQAQRSETIPAGFGGHPTVPDIPGIEYVISSNEALDLPRLPRRIVIVGGGYIAVEFAGIFNGFGAEVVELIRRDELLYRFDDDIRVALAQEMRSRGSRHVEVCSRFISRKPAGSRCDARIFVPDINRNGASRYAIPFFLGPNHDSVVDCVPTCVGPDNPPHARRLLRNSEEKAWAHPCLGQGRARPGRIAQPSSPVCCLMATAIA